jgi:RimJ/RimL family protein N-acetyltransferase
MVVSRPDYGLELTTERLVLRLPVHADLEVMVAIVADAETGRFLGSHSGPAEQFARFTRNAGSWLLYGYGSFSVTLRETREVIGNCGIFHSWRGLGNDFDDLPEAGWILRRDQVGRGLAREAMAAALDWFEQEHIVCMIAPDNAPSLRLAARLGFTPIREAVLPDGSDVRLFERLAAAAPASLNGESLRAPAS